MKAFETWNWWTVDCLWLSNNNFQIMLELRRFANIDYMNKKSFKGFIKQLVLINQSSLSAQLSEENPKSVQLHPFSCCCLSVARRTFTLFSWLDLLFASHIELFSSDNHLWDERSKQEKSIRQTFHIIVYSLYQPHNSASTDTQTFLKSFSLTCFHHQKGDGKASS